MRLSANLGFLYTDLPLPGAIAAAARDGFDAVEFHWPYDVPAAEIAAALAAAGIPGLSLNTSRGDLDAGEFGLGALPGREDDADRALDAALAHAAKAGLGAVHVMAGRTDASAAEAVFVDHLRRGAVRAEAQGLMLLIEPLNLRDVPGYFLTGTDHARRIVEAVNHPALRIMYDLYHMQIMQGDHVARMRALEPLIGHVQVAGAPDRTEPEFGELAVDRVIAASGYSGAVGAEFRPTMPPGDWLAAFRRTQHPDGDVIPGALGPGS